jgi:Domain of unknown function (DUF932)
MITGTMERAGSLYTRTARFDGEQRGLSEKELRKIAPSIFAVEAHESRSDRFAPIPTIEVLRRIAEDGFVPVGAKQSQARDPGRAPYTKHLIRLRRLDGKQRQVGDTVFEMLLKNANDGTAAYHLMAGLWRIRCMNSLVAKTKTLAQVTIRHTGDAPKEVLEASFKVLDHSDRILGAADKWGRIPLSEPERLSFAKKAHKLRFNGKTYGVASAVSAPRLLEARRSGDEGHDLWTTFNVVQENIIRGGQEGEGHDSLDRACRYRSRPVNGIDADVAMNTDLWTLADELAAKRGVLV